MAEQVNVHADVQAPPVPAAPAGAAPSQAVPVSGGGGGTAAHAARATASTVVVILGVLSLVVAPLAVWGRNLVLNTDRYVQTVSPLASDPGVQDAVIAAVDRQVEAHLDVPSLIGSVLSPAATKALAPPLQGAVSDLVNTVTSRFVHSKAFQTLWTGMNRAAHAQIVNVLTGKKVANGTLSVTGGKVVLDLGQVVKNVQSRLVAAGLAVASKVPAVGATLEVAQVKGLAKAQQLVRALDTAADVLPWVGLALIGSGVAIARGRRRAAVRSAVAVCVGMIVIGIGLAIGRHLYLSAVPTTALPRSAAASIFDTLVRYLRWGIRAIFVVALLLAVGFWVSGPGRSATAVRRWWVRGWDRAGDWVRTGPVAPFVARNANLCRAAIVLLVGVAVLFAQAPSTAALVTAAVVVVVLLAAVEGLRGVAAHEARA
jgi:hypothetical protein